MYTHFMYSFDGRNHFARYNTAYSIFRCSTSDLSTTSFGRKSTPLTPGYDYKLEEDGQIVKYYSLGPYDKEGVLYGLSCFVPLDSKDHKVPCSKHIGQPCFFVPPNSQFPPGLGVVYTNTMNLPYPSEGEAMRQKAWHFTIFPTTAMTVTEFTSAIQLLNWQQCDFVMKGAAMPNMLAKKDDDLDDLDDFQMVEVYKLIATWYEQAERTMDRLLAYDIHTWIATDKPSLQDLLQDKTRARYVFSALSRMDAPGITAQNYQGDILGELMYKFGWKENCSEYELYLFCNTNDIIIAQKLRSIEYYFPFFPVKARRSAHR
ncbi:hypothetical protein BC936DRAFT_138513 [Jimgerdemannia flammicorona]|uniref:Uncharacterized protein n=1 Tax=Jimgerdemannia flammicorona TaxID=994334 RepID=A0A433C9J2_9FUNG|nr:hypothetical protein BC936DRAFT_138513 [Jimgerdemannia flammicorona]